MDIKDAEVYASFLSGLVSGVKVNGAELLANKQLDNGMGAADLLAICWFGGAMRGDFERFQAERVYDHAKRALGITDSYQGNADTTAKSGIAKQAQIQQAAGRLLSKREMKKATMADLYRIVFELYLAFSDEPRHVSYVDEFGGRQNIDFNRYDFFEEDPTRPGEYLCNDDYLFSCDQSSLLDQQREQMWQVNLNNLTSGALGNPQDPAVLLRYWMNQERAHYPNAADNVEYFKSVVQQMANAQNGGQNNDPEQQKVV